MIRQCLRYRRALTVLPLCRQQRNLLTLAIETSCDDTSVAVLEKHKDDSAELHFHETVTSDNREYGGVHPLAAHHGHQKSLATLVQKAINHLPIQTEAERTPGNGSQLLRRKPDFVTVTRGPGMRANLMTGMDTAKGLAVAWQVPLLGVNHMQAHALTPRLVSALDAKKTGSFTQDPDYEMDALNPEFPFLTLLVSGGNTLLLHSRSITHHNILADVTDLAIGDMIDKTAREILPPSILGSAKDVMYGRLLESFVFPDKEATHDYTPPSSFMRRREGKTWGYDWHINPPYSEPGPEGAMAHSNLFTFSGIGSRAKNIMSKRPTMDETERRILAREIMALSFEHLASRVLLALQQHSEDLWKVNALVVSGGVASNRFLKTVLRANLDANGYGHLRLIFPPLELCTDNAAMIAWTGMEMYEDGWRTSLAARVVRKWSLDPKQEVDGSIHEVDGWYRDCNM